MMIDDCPIHAGSRYQERVSDIGALVEVVAISDNLNDLNDREQRIVLFGLASAINPMHLWHLSPKDFRTRFALDPFTRS